MKYLVLDLGASPFFLWCVAELLMLCSALVCECLKGDGALVASLEEILCNFAWSKGEVVVQTV